MFQYLTVLYALLLIVFVVILFKVSSFYHCIRWCRKCGRRDVRGSVVNGLSAFLIICYSQCVHITAKILAPAKVMSNSVYSNSTTVVKFAGHLKYFESGHLWYAMPALTCFLIIIFPPLVVLILEPLLIPLLNSSKRGKHPCKWLSFVLNKIRIKLKPFLDSFQACFRYHIFAGLYFVYRLLILFIHLLCWTLLQWYLAVELILFVVLLLHALTRPYEKKWHNNIDIFLLSLLLIVNTLTIFNYYTALSGTIESGIDVLSVFQIQALLLCFPLVYISSYMYMVYCCYKTYMYRPHRKKDDSVESPHVAPPEEDGLEGFPPRLLQEESSRSILYSRSVNRSYQTF